MAVSKKSNIIEKIKAWALNHLPFIFAVLRFFLPIAVFKKFALITRFTDVQEVLSRPDIFGVTYSEKMSVITGGSNFFLGMNNTPDYTRDVSNMRIVFPRGDLESLIPSLITGKAKDIVAKSNGRMEIVSELAGVVPTHFTQEYIGVKGIKVPDLVEWTTFMFQYLFFPKTPEDVDRKAVAYAKKTRAHLDQLIAGKKKAVPVVQDVIGRCLSLQKANTPGMTDTDIRNNIIGIIIGAIPTTSKCVALVLDYLLDHPSLLVKAQEATRSDDNDLLKQIVLETLRFNSFGAGVFRVATQDYFLAKGTFRSRKIRKGSSVLVASQSAMLDGRELSNPGTFKLDRPDYHYMHFGYGMHTCFGKHLNYIQIPLILKALLKCENLRRAKGEKGVMKFRGPFPLSLSVEFEPPG